MNKEFLSFKETASFLNLSESYLYRLTHLNKIPFYRPLGKKIYFKITELNQFLGKNKVNTLEDNLKGIK